MIATHGWERIPAIKLKTVEAIDAQSSQLHDATDHSIGRKITKKSWP